MKLVCRKIYSNNFTEISEKMGGVTIGKEYIVLGLVIKPTFGINAWLINNNKQVVLYDLIGFEITSQKIPERWEFNTNQYEHIYIFPPNMYASDFFENFSNGNPESAEWFCKEAALTYAEEGVIFNYMDEDFY